MMGGIESCLGVFADVINTLGLVSERNVRFRMDVRLFVSVKPSTFPMLTSYLQ